jgi:hypothetical protein
LAPRDQSFQTHRGGSRIARALNRYIRGANIVLTHDGHLEAEPHGYIQSGLVSRRSRNDDQTARTTGHLSRQEAHGARSRDQDSVTALDSSWIHDAVDDAPQRLKKRCGVDVETTRQTMEIADRDQQLFGEAAMSVASDRLSLRAEISVATDTGRTLLAG